MLVVDDESKLTVDNVASLYGIVVVFLINILGVGPTGPITDPVWNITVILIDPPPAPPNVLNVHVSPKAKEQFKPVIIFESWLTPNVIEAFSYCPPTFFSITTVAAVVRYDKSWTDIPINIDVGTVIPT